MIIILNDIHHQLSDATINAVTEFVDFVNLDAEMSKIIDPSAELWQTLWEDAVSHIVEDIDAVGYVDECASNQQIAEYFIECLIA